MPAPPVVLQAAGRRLCHGLLALLVIAGLAGCASFGEERLRQQVIGAWIVDVPATADALIAEVDRALGPLQGAMLKLLLLAGAPAAGDPQSRLADAIGAMRRQLPEALRANPVIAAVAGAATFDFRGDGTLAVRSALLSDHSIAGRWRVDGDAIRIDVPDIPGLSELRQASYDDGRLRLRVPAPADTPVRLAIVLKRA